MINTNININTSDIHVVMHKIEVKKKCYLAA